MKNVKEGNHKPVALMSLGVHSYLFQEALNIGIFCKRFSKQIISTFFKTKKSWWQAFLNRQPRTMTWRFTSYEGLALSYACPTSSYTLI